MIKMRLFVALSLFASMTLAQVIADEFIQSVNLKRDSADSNLAKRQAPLGPSLPDVPIPGLDFLGYGYDLRYERPVDGVRLPLVQYNFNKGKSYVYPTYRDQKYLVPDEVFVRTVGRADAANYVALNHSDMQQALSVGVGVNFQRMVDARMADEAVTPNNTVPTNNSYTSNYTLPAEAGYFDNLGGQLPASQTNGTTKLFTLGLEFDFIKRNTQMGENIVVRNDQFFQLWQLFVDQFSLRNNIQNDIDKLAGKKLEDDPASFGSFFEKYGTHFVFSAVMGGAAQHTALIKKTAKTDFTQVRLGLAVSYNSTTNQTIMTTQGETLIPNSANCTGNKAGYSWNTLKNICQAPAESTCYEEVATLREEFSYNTWDPTKAASAWKSGPNPWPVRPTIRICSTCSSRYWCGLFRICTNYYSCHCINFVIPPGVYRGPATNMSTAPSKPACSNCLTSLGIDGSIQEFTGYRKGVWRYITATNPGLVEFSVSANHNAAARAFVAGEWNGVFAMSDVPQVDKHEQDRHVFVLAYRNVAGPRWQVCMLQPGNGGDYAMNPTYCSSASFIAGDWVKFSIQINWDSQNFTVWYRPQQNNREYLVDAPIQMFREVPFFNRQATAIGMVESYVVTRGAQFYVDTITYCNAAGGSAYKPVTRDTAVQMSQSLMLQSISGKLDFDFQRTHSTTTFEQTSNFRLKGGDTSQIDLLDLAKTTDSFQKWKVTLPENPAPVLYTLKEISYLFPDKEVKGINQRKEMFRAISLFLTELEVGEIIYNTSPDEKTPNFVNVK